ncbi:chorismate--pyruvate lyase [Vibrio navarrensis]|nr:chorismate--pyruvate lyase [Vibrio navarrensis]
MNTNMNQPISPYLALLSQARWQTTEHFAYPNEQAKHWLHEQGSLSRRLNQHCQNLTVELLRNQAMDEPLLLGEEKTLLSQEPCLLREVILSGDGARWVLGRTLIPQSTLCDQPYDLATLGELPLGLTVFSADTVERDALQVAWVETPSGRLLARRSRLWMNHKPMLVAELFLPHAPIYSKESV